MQPHFESSGRSSGSPLPAGQDLPLGEVKQPSGKRLTVWARAGDFDASSAVSNTFEMEWPRKSGRMQTYPEVDRAEWFTVAAARQKLLQGQVEFLDRLLERLRSTGTEVSEGEGPAEQALLFE